MRLNAALQGKRCVDPLVAFAARCEAKAYLVTALEISKIEAVDALQESAVRTGLVEQIGQDLVQLIMARDFAGVS
jgi:hypothetical protein